MWFKCLYFRSNLYILAVVYYEAIGLSLRMETLVSKLGDTDKKIIYMFSQDPEISQSELSARLEISQPAVSARIRKLQQNGTLAHLVGIDVKKAQLFLAKLDVATNHVEQFLKSLDGCPLYLNAFLTSGKNNLTVLLIGENIRSIMSCVDSHLRQNPIVKDMEFDPDSDSCQAFRGAHKT